jgi:hypothetical protein
MNGSEIILLLFIVRIVLPFGLLVLLGEWVRRKELDHWSK